MKRVYFIGAGGIGMAALERYFLSKGMTVAGYDRTPTALTRELIHEGVAISYEDSVEAAVPAEFRTPSPDTLVVYTPAVPHDSEVMTFFREGGFNLVKRAKALGHITEGSKALCFSGTHGKTTTSSMAAHILHSQPLGCNAFLGGILLRYNSNLMLSPTSPYTVAEADEYDRSFHQLRPYIAVVTATDPDHLDIYGTEEAYLESFAHFTELIRPDGALLVHTGLKLVPRPPQGVKTYTYSRHEGDFHAGNIRRGDGRIVFDFVYPGGVLRDIELGVPVDINIDNAVAALAACWLTGELDLEAARRAVASYPGVERRFQVHMRQPGPQGKVVIDDYAHHPDELRSSISSVRALYPGRHLTVAFQPHLYTRTRDFAPEFAEALSMADAVVLADIYPAREEPIPGVSSKIIFDRINLADKVMISKDDFVNTMKNRNFDILLTVGAGDLSFLVPELCMAVDPGSTISYEND
ncbi:MAG: UDP-N-acetylmuramate--L-alanine ligase [Muribaculaceae bacterium]|nr:UDP-N-acetylmuramate--L-alanine ligase [Muribaculaceae bacterium]